MTDRKRDRSAGGTPPNKKQKAKPSGLIISCISCYKSAEEGNIQCECCSGWVHPKCADITDEEFTILGGFSPNIMFFCKSRRPQVSLSLKFLNEIQDKQTELDDRLQQLESKLALKPSNSDQHNITQERSANSVPTTTTNVHHSSQHDRKFNVVTVQYLWNQ